MELIKLEEIRALLKDVRRINISAETEKENHYAQLFALRVKIENALNRLLKEQIRRPVSMHKKTRSLGKIAESVSVAFEVTVSDIQSKSRKQHLVDARQSFCLLARMDGYSFPEIGRYLDRDHSTIVHGQEAAMDHIEVERDFAAKVEAAYEMLWGDTNKNEIAQ